MGMLPFAGAYRLDGGSADARLAEMRPPASAHTDGRASVSWQDGPIALSGHPLADGEHVVVGRVSLYNKPELRERLGGPTLDTDAEYVLAAYAAWGEGCLEHLLGDFAFALWDPARSVLFCARDHAGVEPFHYACTDREFLFAGDLAQIPAMFKRRIDDAVIGDFLLGHVADATSCFYADVSRLPAAHCATIGRSGVRIRRYWQMRPTPVDRDPAEQFRDLFTQAVRSRLDGGEETGVLLSGGLDSSSIACVARGIRDEESGRALPTFSLVYDRDPKKSERRYIDAVLAQGGFDATILAGDDQPPLDDFTALLAEQDGPFLAPHLAGIKRMFRAARDSGVAVLLDGHGGDEVVSHGHARLAVLAKAGRWRKLWTEVGAVHADVGDRTALWLDLVERHAGRPAIAGMAGRTGRLFSLGDGYRPGAFIDKGFALRIGLGERARAYSGPRPGGDVREQHIATLASPLQAYAFEVLHRLNRATGLVGRYPFWDTRLVEFCISVSVDQQLDGGWSRLVLRRAMAGILPQAVRQRRDKFDFTSPLVAGLLAHHRGLIDAMTGNSAHPLFAFVDRAAIAAIFARLRASPRSVDGASVQFLWRAVALGIWLEQRGAMPAADPLAKAA